jgi:hypothetical protein
MFWLPCSAQTRLYLVGGASGSLPYGGYYYEDDDFSRKLGTYAKFKSPFAELSMVSRITGSLYAYTGLGISQLTENEYSTSDTEFEYKQIYAAVPLMLRFNSGNLNTSYFDFGIVPTYLLSGKMSESKGGQSDEANVAKWVPRTDLLFRMAFTLPINRFLIGVRADARLLKKTEAQYNEFKDNWALGSSSTLLQGDAPGNTFMFVYGAFIGLRIK